MTLLILLVSTSPKPSLSPPWDSIKCEAETVKYHKTKLPKFTIIVVCTILELAPIHTPYIQNAGRGLDVSRHQPLPPLVKGLAW